MPRGKGAGLKRPIINISNISSAIEDIERGMTIETAAKKHTIAKTTLWRHYKRHQLSGQQQQQSYNDYISNISNNNMPIFTDEEEIFLAEYIKTLAKLQYGLCGNDIRKFVYLIAQRNNKNMPKTWIENESADIEWLVGFIKRHPSTPLEKSSIAYPPAMATTPTSSQQKIDFNIIPNNLNDSISLYLFSQIYQLMKTTNSSTSEKSVNLEK